MKTLILWMLVITIASVSNTQILNIPDANFKNALISAGVDANKDGEISIPEAEYTTYLNVYQAFISDMTGIEAFINLDTLVCHYNHFTSLDISNNTYLIELSCSHNLLTSLDVTNNTALTHLDCSDNQLTSLDVSNNTALIDLFCVSNQLTSLDAYKNTALTSLLCNNNQLTNLDVSNCTELVWLNCSGNLLTSLDVSNNYQIGEINWFSGLYISDMPCLTEVCVWEGFNLDIDADGSPNVDFTTDCAVKIPDEYKENSTINIYPNPSDDIINIEIENPDNATIEIYNVSGRLLFSKAIDSKVQKIDISGLSQGMYFVKVCYENNVSIEKLIVY